MNEAVFRASSISSIDSAWVDEEICTVLSTMFGSQWERVPLVYLVNPIATMNVNVGGMVDEVLTLRANRQDCTELSRQLGIEEEVSAEELLAELANTLVGHLKVGLADGLTTGIPERGSYKECTGGYHAVFSSGGILLEVVSYA